MTQIQNEKEELEEKMKEPQKMRKRDFFKQLMTKKDKPPTPAKKDEPPKPFFDDLQEERSMSFAPGRWNTMIVNNP